jgi:laccase
MPAQIEPKRISRLCKQHTIITVNGQLPGPTIVVRDGDTVNIKTYNRAGYNATLHWYVSATFMIIFQKMTTSAVVIDRFDDIDYKSRRYIVRHGVEQLRTSWADGPAYITQCPIPPGGHYTYRFNISGQGGTVWWHAHISWLRATVHGVFVIYPKRGSLYPFPKPRADIPIVIGDDLL